MKDKIQYIPEVVVRRLPKYYRLLNELEKEGKKRVSSELISERLNITASQVRQDFSHFGAFGLQGYGYTVESLRDEIKGILGLTREYNIVIVGAGHIGQALANYQGFKREGINVLAVFDIKKEGISVPKEVEILDVSQLKEYASKHTIDIIAITTQGDVAEEIAKTAKEVGIPSIWNFAHKDIMPDEHTVVENINLNESVFTLIYMLNNINRE